MQSEIIITTIVMSLISIMIANVQISALADTDPGYYIGSDVLLFCDKEQIEKMDGVCLKMHSPERREVVFKFDAPWENGHGGYATLIKDDAGIFQGK